MCARKAAMVILKSVPDPAALEDFSPTLPSFVEPELSREVAELMVQLDVQAMRTSLIDLDSMRCRSSWDIRFDDAQAEDPGERGHDRTFHHSMATIIHLNKMPAGQTLTRMLRPQRWAFAWRVDAPLHSRPGPGLPHRTMLDQRTGRLRVWQPEPTTT